MFLLSSSDALVKTDLLMKSIGWFSTMMNVSEWKDKMWNQRIFDDFFHKTKNAFRENFRSLSSRKYLICGKIYYAVSKNVNSFLFRMTTICKQYWGIAPLFKNALTFQKTFSIVCEHRLFSGRYRHFCCFLMVMILRFTKNIVSDTKYFYDKF